MILLLFNAVNRITKWVGSNLVLHPQLPVKHAPHCITSEEKKKKNTRQKFESIITKCIWRSDDLMAI